MGEIRSVARRRVLAVGVLAAAAATSALTPRPLALLGPVLMLLAATVSVHRREDRPAATALALLVGLPPAVVLVGAVVDLTDLSLPGPSAVLGLTGLWVLAASTLGRTVARSAADGRALADAWLRIGAVAVVTAGAAGAMVRLLLPSSTVVERLAWILGEEDNAHVVGVARELLTVGPRGAELADQFGTAFMSLPLLLTRTMGGLPATDGDVRLEAVSTFTLSTLTVIVLAGLAMALLAGLPHHVHPGERRRNGWTATVTASIATGGATFVALSALVVLPMRTGFLTFVWGLTLVLLGAAIVAVLPADAPRAARAVVVATLLGLVVLLIGSWPFILPALLVLLLLPVTWVDWVEVRARFRAQRARWSVGLALLAVGVVGLAVWFSRSGPAAEVLSYGRDILLAVASGITADDVLTRAALGAIVLAGLLVLAARTRGGTSGLLLAVTGPVLGAGALYVGLRVAAAVLTDGELNYAGIKLLYGIVTLAATLGLLAVVSRSTRWGTLGGAASLVAVAALIAASPTAHLGTDWWARTGLGEPPHAVATVEAIDSTSPDIPIRCLPNPGTVVTPTSRLAAYMCVRWMEDAFNTGTERFQGYRDELLTAEGETFGPTVDTILAESPSEYLFAYRMTMGPGWFGWDGRS